MAKKRKVSINGNLKKESRKSILSYFNFTESYTSLILGAIVVLIIAILFSFFLKGVSNIQTISTTDEQTEQSENLNSNTSSTYTIKPGDDLWTISVNIYSDGYKWIEIAKANNIQNPGIILVGDKLIIPEIENKITENNSIDGAEYTVKEGDNLWDISVRAYGDGFKWVELAKVNNIPNPDLIYPNNVLKLPRT